MCRWAKPDPVTATRLSSRGGAVSSAGILVRKRKKAFDPLAPTQELLQEAAPRALGCQRRTTRPGNAIAVPRLGAYTTPAGRRSPKRVYNTPISAGTDVQPSERSARPAA